MDKIIIPLVAAVFGVFGGFAGQWISSNSEHDAKMVEIAIDVLRAQPTEEILGVRRWAIRVINKSSVPLEKTEADDLLKHAIPHAPSLDFSDPRNSQYLPLNH
jgi:hypothetical protein